MCAYIHMYVDHKKGFNKTFGDKKFGNVTFNIEYLKDIR